MEANQGLIDNASSAIGGGVPVLWLLVAASLLIVGHGLARVAPTVWRFGFDGKRALGHRGRALRSLGFALLLGLAGAWLLRALPAVVGVLVLLALVFLLAVTGTLQDVIGGAYGQFRLRLREGDRLTVGAYEGEVRTLHWERLALRTLDGHAIHLPNRLLLREPVSIQSMRSVEPLLATVPVTAPQEADLGRIRDAVAVSPYRAPGTPLSVERTEGGVQVHCYLWSREARDAASRQLEAIVRG